MTAGGGTAEVMEGGQQAALLGRSTALVFPSQKSLVLQMTPVEAGATELVIYVDGIELWFDDPADFTFARTLAKTPRFTAGEAAAWGDIGWNRARDHIGALLDAGTIVRSEVHADNLRHDNQPMPSPLPTAPASEAWCWMDKDNLIARLTGHYLDLAWLEAVVPVFRTAHLFLDAEGRQVGEGNVFPASTRIAVPTDWRGCPYAGNRYQSDKPMNASGLKAMRKHWRPMMALLAKVRDAYLDRFPDARQIMTVGHVERLAVCALALPSVLVLNCADPVANGSLHPVLSNLFRVVDGLRTVMHQMLFVPRFEQMASPDEPVDAQRILDYADRNFSFHSDHGVCAGPRFMIEDMLGVVLEGREPSGGWGAGLDPSLDHAIAAIEPAIDYGLMGLATYGATFSLWPAMARTYQALDAVLAEAPATGLAAVVADRFAGHFAALSHRSFIASEEWRAHREAVYDDMYAQAERGLNVCGSQRGLSDLLKPGPMSDEDLAAALVLGKATLDLFEGNAHLAREFAEQVMHFLKQGQRIVALTEASQERLRQLLRRPTAKAPLTLADLNLHNILMGEDTRSVPFLPDELGQILGLWIAVDAHSIAIAPLEVPVSPTDPAEDPPLAG